MCGWRRSFGPWVEAGGSSPLTTLQESIQPARDLLGALGGGGATPVTYYAHLDHIGRPVMLTDAAKSVVWESVWQPFGEAHQVSGTASLNLRYPGQWLELETGLFSNWHRHYDPSTGRYIQPDPLGMPDGPSRWTYASSSPLMNIDPEGLVEKKRSIGPYMDAPPPPHIPGGPNWRWEPDINNSRGGRWVGSGGYFCSWDVKHGHWDLEDGHGNRVRIDRWGNELTDRAAHNPPRRQGPIKNWPRGGRGGGGGGGPILPGGKLGNSPGLPDIYGPKR